MRAENPISVANLDKVVDYGLLSWEFCLKIKEIHGYPIEILMIISALLPSWLIIIKKSYMPPERQAVERVRGIEPPERRMVSPAHTLHPQSFAFCFSRRKVWVAKLLAFLLLFICSDFDYIGSPLDLFQRSFLCKLA